MYYIKDITIHELTIERYLNIDYNSIIRSEVIKKGKTMDKISTMISVIYSIMLIGGGFMGFVKAHSKWSLITGLISGLFILLSTKIGSKNPKAAYLFIASISLVLAIFFSVRYAGSHAFMPAGLMVILSSVTYIFVARGWLKSK